jgi:aspartyl/asparaginyl-tRNA synthetase
MEGVVGECGEAPQSCLVDDGEPNNNNNNNMDPKAPNGGGINREQMKKMSEADKEMELRANRAKALLAERHIGLRTNQVSWMLSLRAYCCGLYCV